MDELDKIKNEVVESIGKLNNNEWFKCEIAINFPPFSNEGYTTLPKFWNFENEAIKIKLKLSGITWDLLHNLLVKHNQDSKYNQIIFSAIKSNLNEATIKILFSKDVEADFFENIPKSKRGDYTPWYLNEKYNQIKG